MCRGPWSGMSMHPVEHLLYFSVVIPHMFVYGHPIHLFFNAQHTGLTPAGGHHGFDGCEGPGPTKYSGSYFHYLHHRYFEVRQCHVDASMPPNPPQGCDHYRPPLSKDRACAQHEPLTVCSRAWVSFAV